MFEVAAAMLMAGAAVAIMVIAIIALLVLLAFHVDRRKKTVRAAHLPGTGTTLQEGHSS